jgi:hypothetical protein
MIIDVPSHDELRETAIGWLNLAWEVTIETLVSFKETVSYLEEDLDEEPPVRARDVYWHDKRYKLNNAVALLQQSIELLLKARIAEISPYLLIAGDPHTWPKIDDNGEVSFLEFRTIDASQLIRVAGIATASQLPSDFKAFFERVRIQRNKIAHLNAGNMRIEAHKILVDILTAYKFFYPDDNWVEFRKKYMVSTGEYSVVFAYQDDVTHSNFLYELDAALSSLENRYTKAFFGFDKRKKARFCPNCKSLQADWDDRDPDFVQDRTDGNLGCAACGMTFTPEEYSASLAEWT